MSRYPQVPLGELLRPASDEVLVRHDETYRIAGIYSFGRGLFVRPTIQGTDTRYRTLARLHEGQFVFSRLNAWEGAVAVVQPMLAGAFVSQEYPVFDLAPDRVLPSFLNWICQWPRFWDNLTPRGSMVRRKRSHPDRVLQQAIPLPSLERQREIAAWLSELDQHARQASALSRRAHSLMESWSDAKVGQILGIRSSFRHVPLGDVATVNPPNHDWADVDRDRPVSFVPMAAVDQDTGEITNSEIRTLRDAAGYKCFRADDVLFARITPCMENGKAAVARSLVNGIGFGSTEFHVIRTRDRVLPDWIHAILRTRAVRDEAARQFTGTAGQQRVPARFLEALQIPLPTLAEQEQALVRVRELRHRARLVMQHHVELELGYQRLIPSALETALS